MVEILKGMLMLDGKFWLQSIARVKSRVIDGERMSSTNTVQYELSLTNDEDDMIKR